MITQEKLNILFDQATQHREQHDCSAYPYESGAKLVELVERQKPKNVLEIGTGIGYTATIMALADPRARIETIEKDSEHARLARKFIEENAAGGKITISNHLAEQYLATLTESYDLIFFDGFQIHYEFLPYYKKLLRPGGLLVLGNNHLQSRTSNQFFTELNNQGDWQVLEQFAETTVAKRN